MKRFCLSLAFVSLLALSSACSDDDGSTNPSQAPSNDTPNLEEEFGGYTTADEDPAFGDPAILALADAETDADDPMSTDPGVIELQNSPATQAYIMAIRWGQFDKDAAGSIGDDEDGDRFAWDGSLSIDDGGLVLTRVVAFERGDRVLLPRSDPKAIEWESRTGVGMDGIRVVVFAPRAGDDLGSESIVTFDTPLLSRSFTLSELEDLDVIVDVDQEGNQVHFMAMASDAVASINGFVSGRWSWKANDELGTFAGAWVSPRTGVVGWVRGHYGQNEQGEDVFFGKYIDRSGNFQGFLRGDVSIGDGDLTSGSGRFDGGWYGANRMTQGKVQGRWAVSPSGRGLFDGTWCFDCR